jgi:hypothetical protein
VTCIRPTFLSRDSLNKRMASGVGSMMTCQTTIKGEKKEQKEERKKDYYLCERCTIFRFMALAILLKMRSPTRAAKCATMKLNFK